MPGVARSGSITVTGLRALLVASREHGSLEEWAAVAMEWADGADAMIRALKHELRVIKGRNGALIRERNEQTRSPA